MTHRYAWPSICNKNMSALAVTFVLHALLLGLIDCTSDDAAERKCPTVAGTGVSFVLRDADRRFAHQHHYRPTPRRGVYADKREP